MRKIRLNASDRAVLRRMDSELDHRDNWQRRFENALLALALSDPKWIMFVEREIDPDKMSLIEMTRVIESRARHVFIRPHGYFGRKCIGNFIFRDDWLFTDRGTLGPG